jgi:hypothetical protein
LAYAAGGTNLQTRHHPGTPFWATTVDYRQNNDNASFHPKPNPAVDTIQMGLCFPARSSIFLIGNNVARSH